MRLRRPLLPPPPRKRPRASRLDLKARIAANLAAFPRRAIDHAGRRAAVAIVVSPFRGAPSFILTRRALTMRQTDVFV